MGNDVPESGENRPKSERVYKKGPASPNGPNPIDPCVKKTCVATIGGQMPWTYSFGRPQTFRVCMDSWDHPRMVPPSTITKT